MSKFDEEVDKTAELFLKVALGARKPELPSIGVCHNCYEPIAGKFCDNDCEKDYLRRNNNA